MKNVVVLLPHLPPMSTTFFFSLFFSCPALILFVGEITARKISRQCLPQEPSLLLRKKEKKKQIFFLVQAGGHWWEPREESVRRLIVYLSPALSLRLLHSHRQQCHFRTVGSAELRSAKRKCLTLHRRIEQREIVACMASATNLGDEFVSAPMSRLMAITCSVTISFY